MKESFISLIRFRPFMTAWIVSLLALLLVVVFCAIEIRPSDIQVPLRYTAFGITHIYREPWVNELLFPVFALLIFGAHTFVALKLASLKSVKIAVGFQWFTALLLLLVFMTLLAIFKVVAVLQ